MKKIKYIAIAGSSGGHILPAIKYLNTISKIKNPNQILFITNEVGKDYIKQIESNKINNIAISSKNKTFYILKIFFSITPLLILNRKITLVGFGGFITIPVLILSKLFNIFFLSSNKIYIHEQNFIYGLANKINYFISKNAFISFPKSNMKSREIFVGNFFLDKNKKREKIDQNFINILLIGGSAGSLDLNDKMLEDLSRLDKINLEKVKLFIQIPNNYLEIYKKKYENLGANSCQFFTFKNDLNFQEYDLILSRSGSGSINEILYYTNTVHFIPHLISRDRHQKYNLSYFISHKMSVKDFKIPNKKIIKNDYYFNALINPYSIEKIVCYTTR